MFRVKPSRVGITDRVFWKFQSAMRFARMHPDWIWGLWLMALCVIYIGAVAVTAFFAKYHGTQGGSTALACCIVVGIVCMYGLFKAAVYVTDDSWKDWREWLLKAGQQPCRSASDVLTSLPDHALEKVVLQYSDAGDKKSLRLTCRYIRNMVDTNMTAAVLSDKQLSLQDAACWLWRMGRCSKVNSLVLKKDFPNQWSTIVSTMSKCMPQKLTSLYMHQTTDLSILQQLPNLTCLRIESFHEAQLEHLSNCSHLTRLEAPNLMLTSWMQAMQDKIDACIDKALQKLKMPTSTFDNARSLKQERVPANMLPVSLQYLHLGEPPQVEYIAHLTNLKVLVITSRVFSLDTLEVYMSLLGQLQLEHLTWPAIGLSGVYVDGPDILRHLPRSLLSVAFSGVESDWVLDPASMPTRVTRLQLLDLCSKTAIQTFVRAAPGIVKLEVSILNRPSLPPEAIIASIKHVRSFAKLRSLGLYAETTASEQEARSVMGLHQLSVAVPDITQLTTLGLTVQVCNHPSALDPYHYAWPDGPGWATTCL